MSMDLDPNGTFYGVLKTMVQNIVGNMGATEYAVGTVETVGPLSIRISPQILLPADVLILTEAVCMKKVDLTHSHGDPQGGETAPALDDGRTVNTVADVFPDNPPQPPYTIINRDLEVGDRVAMLRVMAGQQYIVFSKVVTEP